MQNVNATLMPRETDLGMHVMIKTELTPSKNETDNGGKEYSTGDRDACIFGLLGHVKRSVEAAWNPCSVSSWQSE